MAAKWPLGRHSARENAPDSGIRGKERKTRTPEQKQAAIDRLAAARRDRTAIVRVQGKEDVRMRNVVAAVAADVNPAEEVYGIM